METKKMTKIEIEKVEKKENQIWMLFILAALLLASRFVNADTGSGAVFERMEVPIGHVFIPAEGYTENENIQFVLDGILPNQCYKVSDQDVHVDQDQNRIDVSLYAFHQTNGDCTDEQHLPAALLPAVPYTINVSVGKLPAGNWKIFYPLPKLTEGVRSFEIERTPPTDELKPADVSDVLIPDTVRGDCSIHAKLIGTLVDTCHFLTPNVSVQLQDDVFVVQQNQGFKSGLECGMVVTPFERSVSLGRAGEGRYMVHVKTGDGNSIDRVFSVVIPDP